MAAGAAADVGLGHTIHADRRHQPRLGPEALEGILERQAVDDGGEHAHRMRRRLVDTGVSCGERRPAEDVATTDDDRQFDPAGGREDNLPGDKHHLLHGDATLAGADKTLPRELEEDAAVDHPSPLNGSA